MTVLTLQRGKLKLKEVNLLAQVSPAASGLASNSNTNPLNSNPGVLFFYYNTDVPRMPALREAYFNLKWEVRMS